MIKRLLDANASDFRSMTSPELIESIRLSEGRVVLAEVIAISPPLVNRSPMSSWRRAWARI